MRKLLTISLLIALISITAYSQPDTLWTRTFGGGSYDGGGSVQQTCDGGYIIAGWTFSYGAGNGDVYLIKTDAWGNEQWSQTFGGSYYDWSYSVQQTNDGGYIIAGETHSFGIGEEFDKFPAAMTISN